MWKGEAVQAVRPFTPRSETGIQPCSDCVDVTEH